VALHAVAVAVELGDAGLALDLACEIDAERLSAERQARYSVDLALAHSMRRQVGEALSYLKLAEELTPKQTRSHRVARAVARDLIQHPGHEGEDTRPLPALQPLVHPARADREDGDAAVGARRLRS
jgi:hypothetical protein